MANDPFAHVQDAIGEPYDNAFAVDMGTLALGDVELPVTCSALFISYVGFSHVRVTTAGGQTIDIYSHGSRTLPLRVTRIHQIDPGADASPPVGVIALW